MVVAGCQSALVMPRLSWFPGQVVGNLHSAMEQFLWDKTPAQRCADYNEADKIVVFYPFLSRLPEIVKNNIRSVLIMAVRLLTFITPRPSKSHTLIFRNTHNVAGIFSKLQLADYLHNRNPQTRTQNVGLGFSSVEMHFVTLRKGDIG